MKKLYSLVYPAVAVLSMTAAVAAFAQDAGSARNPYAEGYSQQADGPSVLTRAQVYAELQRSRAANEGRVYASGYRQLADAPSVRSRAAVHAEAVAANLSGYTRALASEDSSAVLRWAQAAKTPGAVVVANAAR
ncbi:MAG: DUF4148 domain-containing protein [Burkholderiales bacterium]|nr:DUF4148 domain-containing protein [Burkholderiales bacterium]MDE2276943.1 DUF4148 domain-containing protein [Burkholderiales bacterium]